MALEDLSLRDVLYKAYARAVAPSKAIRLVQSRISKTGHDREATQTSIADALLDLLDQTAPSTLSSNYLTEAFNTSLILPQVLVVRLLFRDSDTTKPTLSTSCLISIASVLLSDSWGSTSTQPFPAVLTDSSRPSPPDIGTSASANDSSSDPTPTLSLLLPLLRQCTDPLNPMPLPILALLIRILSALQPYPAPPLQVGLEISGLLPQLPDALGQPLRAGLGGLMADLAISQTAAVLNVNPTPAIQTADNGALPGQTELPPLPPTFPAARQDPSIPLPHLISFLLSYAMDTGKYATSSPSSGVADPPWSNHLMILRAGRYLGSPETFLLHLIEGSLQLVMGTHQTFTPDLQRAMLLVTEWLPGILRYWRDTSNSEWGYPSTLSECLSTAFEASAAGLVSFNTWAQAAYATRVNEAENDEDGAGYVPSDGWSPATVQTMLVRRLVELDLMDQAAAQTLAPLGIGQPGARGESLMYRIASASRASLPVYEALVCASPGDARSLAEEVVTLLANPSQTPIPDNLLTNLSSRPTLLTALACTIPPKQILSTCIKGILEAPIDESARADDPQGILTKFGEGVVFVEAVVNVFEQGSPPLLARSRRAVSLGHLDDGQKACVNGWVKALFGSEGIDDHILLSTMPQDLCWLAPSIIQQAISATSVGQLDRDALHGGLSYFSQPLLSWCLGGIIAWLSSEIIRNGLISAFHLDVLQTVILSDNIPEVLLRMNAKGLRRLLDPSSGLGAVFQSANFDAQALRAKLDSIPGADTAWNSSPNASHPLNVFRSQLHVIRHLSMAQHPWSGPFLTDVIDCLSSQGSIPVLEVILAELNHPSLEFDRTNGDPLAYFAPLLCALPLSDNRPMAEDLISVYLSRILDTPAKTPDSTEIYALCSLVKHTLILSAHLDDHSADHLVNSLMADIKDRSQRPVAEDRPETKRRKLMTGREVPLTTTQKATLDTMKKFLGADEELGDRWESLRRL